MKIPQTSDYITHTDVIRNFVEGPERIKLIDYCTPEEARSVCMLFRQYVNEHFISYVRIIQRGPDIIIYKVRKKK